MINLREPILQFHGNSISRIHKEPETFLKLEDRIYYFYTEKKNYLNYNTFTNYLVVTKKGYYKVISGDMLDITRTKRIIDLEENDEIVAIEPLNSNLFYIITSHNNILLVDIEFNISHLRISERSGGKKEIVKLSDNEEITMVVNRFNKDGDINSLIVVDQFNKVKVIDDAPHRRIRKIPKKFCDTKVKLITVINKNNNTIVGIGNKITLLKYSYFKDYIKKYNGMFKVHSLFTNATEYKNYELVKGVAY